jgi:hypothetical protein
MSWEKRALREMGLWIVFINTSLKKKFFVVALARPTGAIRSDWTVSRVSGAKLRF